MSVLDEYFGIFSEGANDAAYRKQAQDMLSNVQAALRTPKGVAAMEEHGDSLTVNLGELLGNQALEELDLSFVKEDPTKRTGSFKIKPIPTIELNVGADAGDLKKQAPAILQRMRDTFVHEFVHFLDFTRMGARGPKVFGQQAAAQKGGEEAERNKRYVNSPMEFNAFFQQGIGNIENYLKSLPPESRLKVATKIIGSTPNEFMKRISDLPWFRDQFLKNLNDKNKTKFMKRIAQAHTEIMKREKAAQKWRGGPEKDREAQISKLKASNMRVNKPQEKA